MKSEISFTSVTFREKTVEEILRIAAENDIACVEWGGDVHVPPGLIAEAKRVLSLMQAQNMRALSYGSYFKLLCGMDFTPYAESAAALGAKTIRIWAGDSWRRKRTFGEDEKTFAAEELRKVCLLAQDYGLTVCLEKHRYTLTENAAVARALIEAVGMPNLKSYWQPNPELSIEENLGAIETLSDYITNVHVFSWTADNARLSLKNGEDAWKRYIDALGARAYILEFVKGDSQVQFAEDVNTLRAWVQ